MRYRSDTQIFFQVLAIIGLIISSLSPLGITEAQANWLSGSIIANLSNNSIRGVHWTPGVNVFLDIDDPAVGSGVDFHASQMASAEGVVDFNDLGAVILKSGVIITMGNGVQPDKQLIPSLQVTGVDFLADTIMGRSNQHSNVTVQYCNQDGCLWKRVAPVQENGNWNVDFKVAGTGQDEQQILDVQPWRDGNAMQWDEDFDMTSVVWGWHFPAILAFVPTHIELMNWPAGSVLTLAIDDPDTTQTPDFSMGGINVPPPAQPGGYTMVVVEQLPEYPGYDFKPGDVITVSDDTTTKVLTVSNLQMTTFDLPNDVIYGKGTPGLPIFIEQICDPSGCAARTATPNAQGDWSANYARLSGIDWDERTLFDLVPGISSEAHQYDADGDTTGLFWHIPNPRLTVNIVENSIDTSDWGSNTSLHITINDPDLPDEQDFVFDGVPPESTYDPEMRSLPINPETFKLKAGQLVTVTGGITTKTHTITPLSVNETIDIDNDIISGTAEPGSSIFVGYLCTPYGCAHRNVQAGGDGNWTANFGVVDQNSGGVGTFDIKPGLDGQALQTDEDGDTTRYLWYISPPGFWGAVYDADGNLAPGVAVEACKVNSTSCWTALTNEGGYYFVAVLEEGSYTFRAFPADLSLPGRHEDPIEIYYYTYPQVPDIHLPGYPIPAPADAVEPAHDGGGTLNPYFLDPLTLTAHGCINGTASYSLEFLDENYYTLTGEMTETPAGSGTYQKNIPPLYPHHGPVRVVYTITCPDATQDKIPFFMYVDPSGVVKTVSGEPISGAKVTLLYSDNLDGPFYEIPEGDPIMSPSNRANPDTTDANGRFGWDVMAGFYKVKAEKTGCYAPGNPSIPFVESPVLTIPPPITDLELILECPDTTPPAITWSSEIDDGDIFYFNFVPTEPTCTASDSQSGMDGECLVTGYSTGLGTHTLVASAKDKAGNASIESRTYSVEPWTLKGFYQPVDMNGIFNVAKNGSTIPFKFEVFAGATELTNTAYIISLAYSPIACDPATVLDVIETTVLGGTSLRYDPAAGQFIYNWKTPSTAGKCYRVTLIAQDNSTLVAYFKLK